MTVTGERELRHWIKDKKNEWVRALALRSALRALPSISVEPDNSALQLAVFRVLSILWTANIWLSDQYGVGHQVRRSASSAAAFASFVSASTAHPAADTFGYAVAQAAKTWAGYSPDDLAAVKAISMAADALEDRKAFWEMLSDDVSALERGGSHQDLLRKPLWRIGPPAFVTKMWGILAKSMLSLDSNNQFWIDWYENKLNGRDYSVLKVPYLDEDIGIKLLQQPDSFWRHPQKHVNSSIVEMVDDVINRGGLIAEPQNPLAPTFAMSADGKIDLDPFAGVDRLRKDDDAIERYEEVVDATDRAIDICVGNAAAATRIALQRYRSALGDSIGSLRPTLVVQRGEIIRQEIAARDRNDPDSNLAPIQESAMLSLKEVVSAHNLLVGLDPELARREEIRLGPDREFVISKLVAQQGLATALNNGVLTESAQDVIEMAIALAPDESVDDDRRSNQLTETIKNFGRKAVSLIFSVAKAPVTSGAVLAVGAVSITSGITTGAVAGPLAGTSTGAAVAMAGLGTFYKIGQWVQKNEPWFREIFSENALMQRVLDRLYNELRNLPMK